MKLTKYFLMTMVLFAITTVEAAEQGGEWRAYTLVDAANTVASRIGEAMRGQVAAVLDARPLNAEHDDLRRLGHALGDELRHALDRQPGVTVLERDQLDQALVELRLNQQDLFDPENRKRFGRFTGTRILVKSDLVEEADTIELLVRVINLQTGEVLKDVSVRLIKDADTFRLRGITAPGLIRLKTSIQADVYMDGMPAGRTNDVGRLDLEVNQGRHRIEVKQENYAWQSSGVGVRSGEAVDLRLELTPLPDPDALALRSTLIPGWGDLALGQGDFWIYPVVVYGSIYGAMVYKNKINDWVVTTDPQTGKETIEKRGWWPVYGLAALAFSAWVYDIGHVYSTAKGIRMRNEGYMPKALTMQYVPDSKAWTVAYRWDW